MKTEINLGAIKRNFNLISKATEKPLILMCKADAYGHGAARVVREVSAAYYGVATEEEGIPLRELGKNVLVTAPSFYGVALCRRYGMIPLIGDMEVAKRAVACGVERCRIKVNSGMNRLGFTGDKECFAVARFLARNGVAVEGADTHYKDDSDLNLLRQNDRFKSAVVAVRSALAEEGRQGRFFTSVTECGATFAKEFDFLRVGLAAYGYHNASTAGIPLELAMKVYSEVIKVKTVKAGETLGYTGAFTAPKKLKAYTVLGGYGDGVARADAGRRVFAAGRRLCVAAVSMDTFEMISDHVDLSVGTRVIILSRTADAAYIAKHRGTIPYEVLLGFNVPRANRVYV